MHSLDLLMSIYTSLSMWDTIHTNEIKARFYFHDCCFYTIIKNKYSKLHCKRKHFDREWIISGHKFACRYKFTAIIILSLLAKGFQFWFMRKIKLPFFFFHFLFYLLIATAFKKIKPTYHQRAFLKKAIPFFVLCFLLLAKQANIQTFRQIKITGP